MQTEALILKRSFIREQNRMVKDPSGSPKLVLQAVLSQIGTIFSARTSIAASQAQLPIILALGRINL